VHPFKSATSCPSTSSLMNIGAFESRCSA
jgi:hypothetical protein